MLQWNRNVLTDRKVRRMGRQDGASEAGKPHAASHEETDAMRYMQAVGDEGRARNDEAFAAQLKPLLEARAELEPEFQRRAAEYQRMVRQTGRNAPIVLMGGPCYWTLWGLFLAGEAAFNSVAFNVLGETRLQTALCALAIVVALPVTAHVIGLQLRHAPGRIGTPTTAIVALASALAGLIGVNAIRMAYLDMAGDRVFSLPPGGSAFLLVNACIVGASAVLTWMHEDPQEGYVKTYRRLRDSEKRCQQLEARITAGHAEHSARQQSLLAAVSRLKAVYSRERNRTRERLTRRSVGRTFMAWRNRSAA